MMTFRFLLLLAVLPALAACATKAPPPAIQYDSASFRPAAVEPEPPKPVEVVEIATPLPLPGQLQPEPSAPKRDKRPPTVRVAPIARVAPVA